MEAHYASTGWSDGTAPGSSAYSVGPDGKPLAVHQQSTNGNAASPTRAYAPHDQYVAPGPAAQAAQHSQRGSVASQSSSHTLQASDYAVPSGAAASSASQQQRHEYEQQQQQQQQYLQHQYQQDQQQYQQHQRQQQQVMYSSPSASSSSTSASTQSRNTSEYHQQQQAQLHQQQHGQQQLQQPRMSIRHAPTPTMLHQPEYAEHRSQARARAPAVPPAATGAAGGVRTRTYGLARDLRGPSADSAHLPFSSGGMARAGGTKPGAEASSPTGPNAPKLPAFSVEIQAQNFDVRGYPILSGRAANVRGTIRMNAVEGCDVVMRLWAYTSQGAPAAVWDGIALMPPDQGSERKVFEVTDKLTADFANVRPRPAAPGDAIGANFPASDDMILSIPFDVRMPLGAAARFVDGRMQNIAVALPPSFEMSSESDSKDREAARGIKDSFLRSSSQSVMTKMSISTATMTSGVKEALEKGFGEIYRIGCFYSMSFTLQRKEVKEKATKTLLGRKSKKEKEKAADTITIPFVFLGEAAPTLPPPVSLPSLHKDILFRTGMRLAEGWDFTQATAKWGGSLKTLSGKRTVELELHMPTIGDAQPCLHAPSVFPVLLIIRPNDPNMLPAPRQHGAQSPTLSASASWTSNLGSPNASVLNSPAASVGYGSPPSSMTMSLPPSAIEAELESPIESHEEDAEGKLSRFMRSSLHLSRTPSNRTLGTSNNSSGQNSHAPSSAGAAANATTGKTLATKRSRASLASTFGRNRRPSTAPGSSLGSSSPPESLAATVMPGGDRDTLDLARLVRISLLQTTYCTSNGPSDMPKIRRRVISLAEIEEIDVASIIGGPTSPSLDGVPEESTSSAASRAVVSHARATGVRVVRGSIRVGRDTTPSFRCQGIEVKYAIKVDLLPFSLRQKRRPASGGGVSNNSGSSLGDALRSINENKRTSVSTARGPSSFADGVALHAMSSMSSNGSEPPRTPPMPHSGGSGGILMRPNSGGTTVAGSPTHRASPSTAASMLHGSPIQSEIGGARSFIGGGGTTVIGSTVYDGEGGIGKIDKTVGALWTDVRLVRAQSA